MAGKWPPASGREEGAGAGRGLAAELADAITGFAGRLVPAEVSISREFRSCGANKYVNTTYRFGVRKGGAPSYEHGPTFLDVFESFCDGYERKKKDAVEWLDQNLLDLHNEFGDGQGYDFGEAFPPSVGVSLKRDLPPHARTHTS